jgi:hypothetical protein|tara:strand:+ start:335 stop:529 length:195 start_codon:yes stop_codon:yes gene_type:complete
MNTNYTLDVYNRLMKTMKVAKPATKSNGLLTRTTKSKPSAMSEVDVIREYVSAIQEERGNVKNG